MKFILFIFFYLYCFTASLTTINKPQVKQEEINIMVEVKPLLIVEFVENYFCEISVQINELLIPTNCTDEDIIKAIEHVCQKNNLNIEQTFYIYKVFYL